jgi:hypothetical protein
MTATQAPLSPPLEGGGKEGKAYPKPKLTKEVHKTNYSLDLRDYFPLVSGSTTNLVFKRKNSELKDERGNVYVQMSSTKTSLF